LGRSLPSFSRIRDADNIAVNEAEAKKQVEAGIEVITLSDAESEKWLTTARDAGWAAVSKVDAALADDLRSCMQ